MKVEKRLKELGIELAKPTTPMGSYVNAVRTGNLLYMAGKGPGLPGKPLPVGKVGRDFSLEQANRRPQWEPGRKATAIQIAPHGCVQQERGSSENPVGECGSYRH